MATYQKVGSVDVFRKVPEPSGCLLASIALLTGFSGFIACALFMIF